MISKQLEEFLMSHDFEGELPGFSDIEKLLFNSLKKCVLSDGDGVYPDLFIEGSTGSGKTSKVVEWARENRINLVRKNASSYRVYEQMLHADKNLSLDELYALEFGGLDVDNSVLVLDDYHFASEEVKAFLSTILASHKIPDKQQADGFKKLDNWLFTVAIKSI